MHIHILGICGTFMAGVALLAKAMGHRVTGSDAHMYPPMSDLLAEQALQVSLGYEPRHLSPTPDLVIVGNAMTRGNPAVEHMLAQGMHYTSGPQWLAENVLQDRHVLAVAGTHGKTTCSAMLAWILESAHLDPGFLIGGMPGNFPISARLGSGPFVVEADEYDSAFFDKRSKFIHYRPRTVILNNLEFDHADIFDSLHDIQRQFHHLVRTVPNNGLIVYPPADTALNEVLSMGLWTPVATFGTDGDWRLIAQPDGGGELRHRNETLGATRLSTLGEYNRHNAMAALLAARHAGVPPEQGLAALTGFRTVKRRQELIATVGGIRVFDDFAHHPSAIAATLEALKPDDGGRLLALFEPASNTMRRGVHARETMAALTRADRALLLGGDGLHWDPVALAAEQTTVFTDADTLLEATVSLATRGDTIVMMSNAGFGGLRHRLIAALRARHG